MSLMSNTTFTIGELSKRAQVNVQTVRFYEREGMLEPVARRDSGYRVYDGESLKRLIFIRHAKELGFSLKEIGELLKLRIKSTQGCNRVRAKASEKLGEIQRKIRHLKSLESTLVALISDCENRVVSDCCPILGKMES
jgi:MerR family copper efflux transcriptional regulator